MCLMMVGVNAWADEETLAFTSSDNGITIVKAGEGDPGGDTEVTKGNVTVTSSGGQAPDNKALQIYKTQSMTVAVPSNYVITKIDFTYASSCYPFAEAIPTGLDNAKTKTASGKTAASFTPQTPASSLTFTNIAGGQTKINKMVVTYQSTSTGGGSSTEKTLSAIAVTTQPTKAEYTVGDALDLTGCVVTATYSDNTTSNVTSSCTFSPANGAKLETAGTQKVTVSYESKTTSFNVTVNAATTPDSGDENGNALVGAVLWAETFESTNSAGSDVELSKYDYSGRSGFSENATSVTYTVSDATNARWSNSSATGVSGCNLWLKKQTRAEFVTSAINLYGAKKVSFEFTKSKSKLIVYWSVDKTNWTQIYSDASATAVAEASPIDITIPSGATSIYIKLKEGNNSNNCRVDNLALKVVKDANSTDSEPQNITLSFSQTEVTATLGEEFVAPTLTNESGVEVVYSSSNTKVATVNAATGAVTLVGAGTTTIKAAFAGNDAYNAAEASYTLIVKQNVVTETEGDGTKENPYTIADVIKLNNSTSGKVWVVGYIMGNYKSETELNADPQDSNIALGETAGASSFLPVQLPSGSVRTALNVKDNPTNVGRMVKVYGSLESYFSTTGIKSVTDYEFVEEPSSFTLTLQAEGPLMPTADISGEKIEHMYYATFSSNKDVVLDPENVVFVGGIGLDEGYISVMPLDAILDGYQTVGFYIPANKGVMIVSTTTEATYSYASAIDNLEEYYVPDYYLDEEGNLLHPASEAKTGDFKFYKLAYEDATMKPETLGFYWGAENGAAFTSRVGSAYLAVPEEAAAKGFRLVEDEATAIKNVANNKVKTNAVYNLAGQRVADKNFKGIVIKNGKKMLNK